MSWVHASAARQGERKINTRLAAWLIDLLATTSSLRGTMATRPWASYERGRMNSVGKMENVQLITVSSNSVHTIYALQHVNNTERFQIELTVSGQKCRNFFLIKPETFVDWSLL